MRASSHGRSSAFSGRTILIEVPRKSVLRFFGHSLISNSEGGAGLVWEGSDASIRRGTVRTQNHIIVILFTSSPPCANSGFAIEPHVLLQIAEVQTLSALGGLNDQARAFPGKPLRGYRKLPRKSSTSTHVV